MLYWLYVEAFNLIRLVQNTCCPTKRHVTFKNVDYPWLWIGTTGTDGQDVTVTPIVNNSVFDGCVVNADFLASVTGVNTAEWRYLDATTLKELDFPKEGITIRDDSDKRTD
jgi:hypothetical protein